MVVRDYKRCAVGGSRGSDIAAVRGQPIPLQCGRMDNDGKFMLHPPAFRLSASTGVVLNGPVIQRGAWFCIILAALDGLHLTLVPCCSMHHGAKLHDLANCGTLVFHPNPLF